MSEKTHRGQTGAIEVKAARNTSEVARFSQVHPLIEEAFAAPVLYSCGAPAKHLGRHLCASSAEHRPVVRPHLCCKPWPFQLPHNHPEAHALVFLRLSGGHRGDDAFPLIITDVLLGVRRLAAIGGPSMNAPHNLAEARAEFVLAMLRRHGPFGLFTITEEKECWRELALTLRQRDEAIDYLVATGQVHLSVGPEGVSLWVGTPS